MIFAAPFAATGVVHTSMREETEGRLPPGTHMAYQFLFTDGKICWFHFVHQSNILTFKSQGSHLSYADY